MPAARPSMTAVKNVIEAMKACGMKPGPVRVYSDGGFVVEPEEVDRTPKPVDGKPRQFGQPK